MQKHALSAMHKLDSSTRTRAIAPAVGFGSIQNSGEIAYANMAGGTFHGWVSLGSTPGWKLVGAGDINGPANDADIVIQNQSTGQILYGNIQNGALHVAGTPGQGFGFA